MENNIRLTIGIATYNRPDKLKTLIRSLYPLITTCDLIEVVICNDGGELGDVPKFVNSINKVRPNAIKLINRKENKGIYYTRYELLSNASGRWYLSCDDDDLLDIFTVKNMLTSHCYNYNYMVQIFNLVEFYHNLKDGSTFIKDMHQYYSANPARKIVVGLSGSILNMDWIRHKLPMYGEFISSLVPDKNIGEDQILIRFFFDGKPSVKINPETLYLADYSKSDEHMMLTNMKENTIDNLKSIKTYIPNTIANGE